MIYLGKTPIGVYGDNRVLSYVTQAQNMFYYGSNTSNPKPVNMPEKVSLDLPACLNIQGMCGQYIASEAYSIPLKEISIKLYHPVIVTSFARRNSQLTKVEFPNGLTITSSYYDVFTDATKLKSVIGPIGFYNPTNYSTTYNAFNAALLEDIEFVPNCIIYDISFDRTSSLTNESVVSIVNGLNESAENKTLTMSSGVKTRMQNIMGTSTIPTGETYHVFAIDENGTVTLSDFVTTVKGWTLA